MSRKGNRQSTTSTTHRNREGVDYIVKRSSAGLGLFALRPFKKDEFIVEYRGRMISGKEADDHGGKYLFEINKREVIDGSSRTNIARYINHSCRPNAYTDIKKKKIYVYAKRALQAGEEFAYDYGKEYFDDFIKTKGCQCSKCRENKTQLQ